LLIRFTLCALRLTLPALGRHSLPVLQFSLTGNGNQEDVITDSAEDAAVDIAVAVAEVLASVTGTVRASAQQGCEIDLDPVARVRTSPRKLHTRQ